MSRNPQWGASIENLIHKKWMPRHKVDIPKFTPIRIVLTIGLTSDENMIYIYIYMKAWLSCIRLLITLSIIFDLVSLIVGPTPMGVGLEISQTQWDYSFWAVQIFNRWVNSWILWLENRIWNLRNYNLFDINIQVLHQLLEVW